MSDPYSTHPYPTKTEVRRRWSAESVKATKTWQGLKIVALNCDNARNADGAGFGAYDAQFGKDIVAKGETYGWSEAQFRAAHKLAHKYRKQIAAGGITEEEIGFEDLTATKADVKAAGRPGDELVWVRGAGPVRMGVGSDKSHHVLRKGRTSFRGTGNIVFLTRSLVRGMRGDTLSDTRMQYDNLEFLMPLWWAQKNADSVDVVKAPSEAVAA